MLSTAGRPLEQETLAVLGLGSIGQSCLRLLLEIEPHPRIFDTLSEMTELQSFGELTLDVAKPLVVGR